MQLLLSFPGINGMKQLAVALVVASLTMLAPAPASAGGPESRPALVLFITVDQLRGDMPMRALPDLRSGGFRLLLERGVGYTNAHFRHSTTFTAVGHATLFTGGNAPEHGIVGNNWVDPVSGKRVYSCEDHRHLLLDAETQEHQGTSPRNMTSSTVGDELITASGGVSRVFSVSIKDRGAILPGGHLGKAFWYDSRTGQFVTSSYYYDRTPPQWVSDWNEKRPADAWRDTDWKLLDDVSTYHRAADDDRIFEASYGSLGRTLP
ncbi:MAG: alkaline phosphatase family protein, partial [Planctomycetota bacterium]